MTAETQAYVAVLLNDPCSYCGKRVWRIDIDHIVPPALGGTSDLRNLTACCVLCNVSKRRQSLLAFTEEMGFREFCRRESEAYHRRKAKAQEHAQ